MSDNVEKQLEQLAVTDNKKVRQNVQRCDSD